MTTEDIPPWPADVLSDEKRLNALALLQSSEQLKLLRVLLPLCASLVTEMRETNQLLRQSIAHTSIALDQLMSMTTEDDDDGMPGSVYLDDPPRN